MRIKARINEEGGEDKEGRHKKVWWRRGGEQATQQ